VAEDKGCWPSRKMTCFLVLHLRVAARQPTVKHYVMRKIPISCIPLIKNYPLPTRLLRINDVKRMPLMVTMY